jgi:hypothetical protein
MFLPRRNAQTLIKSRLNDRKKRKEKQVSGIPLLKAKKEEDHSPSF